MCIVTDISYPSSDGVNTVFAKEWAPASTSPRGVVQIVHGMAEYIERYDDFARFLAQNGFVVVGEDHLGHGKTATGIYGYFGDAEGAQMVADDIRALQVRTQARFAGVPYFILGHSLGSFFTRYHMVRWPGTTDGIILSGTGSIPAIAGKIGAPLMKRMGKKHGRKTESKLSFDMFNKKFAPNRTKADWISRDEAIVDAYVQDPMTQFGTTYGMAYDLLSMLDAITDKKELQKMDPKTPVYIFSGDKDPVGGEGKGVKKVYGMYKENGFDDVTMKLYPDGRHEMLNEINRDEVYRDVLGWLEKHTAKA